MTWVLWLLGAGGWFVAAVLVALGAGRLIAAADRATRPETASDASEHGVRTTTPDRTRPDAGDPSQRPESASTNVPSWIGCRSHTWIQCADVFTATGRNCCADCTGRHLPDSLTQSDHQHDRKEPA